MMLGPCSGGAVRLGPAGDVLMIGGRGGRATNTIDVIGSDDPIRAAINEAEEVRDPLEGLAERTPADPGAAFAPEVLERLAALKRDNRGVFEALRAQLKSRMPSQGAGRSDR
jgi:hypothetical protein